MADILRDKIGITEVNALTLWFRSRLGKYINVVFDPHAETAYVTLVGGKLKAVLPTPNANTTLRDAIRLRGFGLHEYGHPRWQPDIWNILDKYPTKTTSPLGGIYNALLDVHSETLTANEYTGDAKALSEFAVVVGRDVYEKLGPMLKDNGNVFPDNFRKMCAVMTAAHNAEATWNVGMKIGFDKVINNLYDQQIRDKGIELDTKFSITRKLVDEGKTFDEWQIWDLSKDIFEYLWEKDPESEIGKPPPGKKGEKAKDDGEGEDKTKKEGEGEEEDEAGKPKPGGTEGEGDEQPEEKIPLDELLWSHHYETQAGEGGSGQGFDYVNYKTHREYTPVDPTTFKVINYGKGGR